MPLRHCTNEKNMGCQEFRESKMGFINFFLFVSVQNSNSNSIQFKQKILFLLHKVLVVKLRFPQHN